MIRIQKVDALKIRFPDPAGNPYLSFAAMMMAGLDGIRNKIHPGDPMDKDLYDLPPEEAIDIPTVCASLEDAVSELKNNHAFLIEGDVFSMDLINSYIDLKMEEITALRMTTHPIEFDLYYSS